LIYFFFSSFRSEEFEERLSEKALTTAKLLLEVKEVDKQLLKLIDENTIHKLHNEKTLVFDENLNLIYSSIDDTVIDWDMEDLKRLKEEKSFFRKENQKDVLGIFYDFEKTDYYVFISAEDKYGNNKLNYLFYLLSISFSLGIAFVWISSYFLVAYLLKPLDFFEKQITTISVNNLQDLLPQTSKNEELILLTKAFNTLLVRINKAFSSQKEFTSNASHELRTPLTRISFQLENLSQYTTHTPEVSQYLKNMSYEVNQLTDLVNSLLLLSKVTKTNTKSEKNEHFEHFEHLRIDEIIFFATQEVRKQHPNFELNFEILEDSNKNSNFEISMEIEGIKSLLESAFINLLKNAYNYSDSKKATLTIEQISETSMRIRIFNDGNNLSQTEQNTLFEPFFRGENATSINGSGLGLRIVKRIFDYHQFSIKYTTEFLPLHCFELELR
jgi:signal transduction histidine kinase